MQRLTLSLISVVLLALLGLSWAIDQWYWQQFAPRGDKIMLSFKQVAAEVAQQLNAQHLSYPQLVFWAEHSALSPQILPYAEFPVPANLAAEFEAGAPLVLDSAEQISLHYFLSDSRSVLSLNLPWQETGQQNHRIKMALTLGFYGGVIGLILIWLTPLMRRLDLLRQTAEAVGRGDLSQRIPSGGVSYIRGIEQEFNAMAARLENLIRDNKILSRGLSHDLRTPLARLRFGVDVLVDEALDPALLAKLEHLNRDLWDMELLVEILLEYGKLEENNIRLQLIPLDLTALLRELIAGSYQEDVQLMIQDSDVKLIAGHPEYLAMLFNNIIQNALRYGNGVIRLSITQSADHTLCCLEDNGQGIAESERQHVLMPFYRAANTSNIKGHGMGLALVERIAHWHNATLELTQSKTLGGLQILLKFQHCN